jgi:hypothetical protein
MQDMQDDHGATSDAAETDSVGAHALTPQHDNPPKRSLRREKLR